MKCNGRKAKSQHLSGYNDFLLIPAGATNIRVEEIRPSNNYLGKPILFPINLISYKFLYKFVYFINDIIIAAIRSANGSFYLNGKWRIDFPKSWRMAGTIFHYSRYPQGFPAPDKISCLGPTNETLYIVVSAKNRTG